jgi:SAM-dependent methyltransferase
MSKNLYDNQEFWVGQVHRAKQSGRPNDCVWTGNWDVIVDVRVNLIRELTNPTDKIIDFGCGYGWLSQEIENPYVGVDQTTALIDYGKELYPDVQFIEAKMQNKLPFADGSFDIVFSSCVKYGIVECEELGEMPKGRWSKIEKEMMRLAPKAIIFPSYGNTYEILER